MEQLWDKKTVIRFAWFPKRVEDNILWLEKYECTYRYEKDKDWLWDIGGLLCKIGWHQFTCNMQDCIDEFGCVPSDGRMPKVSKCSRCGKNYT